MSTNGTYLDRLIDSIMLPLRDSVSFVSSKTVDIVANTTETITNTNCVFINVSDLADCEASDVVKLSNSNNVFRASVAEYKRFAVHHNQVFKDSVQIDYQSNDPEAVARFEFVILQIVPKSSI